MQTVTTTSCPIAMIQIMLCLLFYRAQTKTTYVILETEGVTGLPVSSHPPGNGALHWPFCDAEYEGRVFFQGDYYRDVREEEVTEDFIDMKLREMKAAREIFEEFAKRYIRRISA